MRQNKNSRLVRNLAFHIFNADMVMTFIRIYKDRLSTRANNHVDHVNQGVRAGENFVAGLEDRLEVPIKSSPGLGNGGDVFLSRKMTQFLFELRNAPSVEKFQSED